MCPHALINLFLDYPWHDLEWNHSYSKFPDTDTGYFTAPLWGQCQERGSWPWSNNHPFSAHSSYHTCWCNFFIDIRCLKTNAYYIFLKSKVYTLNSSLNKGLNYLEISSNILTCRRSPWIPKHDGTQWCRVLLPSWAQVTIWMFHVLPISGRFIHSCIFWAA